MLEPVVADGVDAAVDGVGAEVGNVDAGGGLGAADEELQFLLVEHAEPGGRDDGGEAAEEGGGLGVRLGGEAVAGEVGDVDEAVCVCDGDEGAVGLEVAVVCLGARRGGGVCGRERDRVGDGEGEAEVGDVAGVVLEFELGLVSWC